jgi:hypothetical protein
MNSFLLGLLTYYSTWSLPEVEKQRTNKDCTKRYYIFILFSAADATSSNQQWRHLCFYLPQVHNDAHTSLCILHRTDGEECTKVQQRTRERFPAACLPLNQQLKDLVIAVTCTSSNEFSLPRYPCFNDGRRQQHC